MCTCITFCWILELLSTIMIVSVAFGGRELYVLALHSAGPHQYQTLH